MRFLAALLVLSMSTAALASDADLAQYNRPAANAEAANAASALLGALLVVRDGKGITADSNGTNSAPVNKSIKQIADAVAGIRCALFGNCMGVNHRTVASLYADGSGGAISMASNGNVQASAALIAGTDMQAAGVASVGTTKAGTSTPTTANSWGTITKESAIFCYAQVGSGGLFIAGFNVKATAKTSTGTYTVTCNGSPTNYGRTVWSLTPGGTGTSLSIYSVTLSGSDLRATVAETDFSSVPTDGGFYVQAWGG